MTLTVCPLSNLRLCMVDRLETQSLRLLVEHGVDGIVWVPNGDKNTAGGRLAAELAFHVSNGFSIDLEPKVKDAIKSRKATAIFVGADLIALGVIQYARSIGMPVPSKLSIVGFDDIPWAQISQPPLTTVEIPVGEMAAEAVEAVLRKSRDQVEPRRKIVFDMSLIERGSVARRK